jgi:hypothetical protein
MLRVRLLLPVMAILFSCTLGAQIDQYKRLPLPDNGSTIQSPEAFLGYRLGERFTEYARSVEYFKYLAEQSPRINLEQYGETYEKRPLIVLTVSDVEHMKRIEEIRLNNLKLVEAYKQGKEEVEAMVAEHPVINSYSYNIHGNEASSTEAAMQVAYELATTKNTELLDALKQTVNLLFICINPDGRDRYVYWANSVARATGGQEPRDLEHYAPWPNGRTNHYWFDLNRDWIWGVHPESRGHTAHYQKWMPQVHTDYHEQGYDANYFTVPGTTPRNLLLPEAYETWADTFGRANVTEFNKKGLSYFTRDRFDFYYPSYGSSYPSVMGAIGMLTEQGGIGGHRAIETEDGYVLTFRQRIYDHYTTSLAQVRAAARNRKELIEYSLMAWNPLSSKAMATAYLLEDDGSEYFGDVVNILLANGVEVERTTEPLTASGASYRDGGRVARRTHPAGSVMVSTEQARHLFVNSILSKDMQIEDSVMYDMSTWSAPIAYNLEAFSFQGPITVDTEPITSPMSPEGGVYRVDGNGPAYAYVISWHQRHAPKFLSALWQKGIRVRSAVDGFTADDGTEFSAGSLVILAGRNLEKGASLDGTMTMLAREFGVKVHRFTTGRMAEGNDLASTRNFPVKMPRAAMLVEPPFNTYTSGQLYFLFDQETQLPVERIRASILNQTDIPKFGTRYGTADLNDYDVLILPNADGLDQVFGKEGQAALKRWLTAGGTLVAIGSSAEFFTEQSGFLKGQKLDRPDRDTSEKAANLAYRNRTDYFGKQRIPGTALNASIDVSHPLAFGVKEDVYTLKFGNSALTPDVSLQSVGRYAPDAEELLAAGYASTDNLEHLAGKTWCGMRTFGRGKIVYFIDNPHYRMFWRGPSRMMQNAVMIVPGM